LTQPLQLKNVFGKKKPMSNGTLKGTVTQLFFQNIAKIKAKTNKITSIKDGEQLITEPEQIKQHFTNHL